MGQKLQKRVRTTSTTTYTDYQSGFHYENYGLTFFATAEGYVNVSAGRFNYVYNYTDHLGNVRLSYTHDRLLGVRVIEENNYYPFGLKHNGYNNISPPNSVYKYKVQNKEWQDELGLNVYDFHARLFDPATGRTMVQDPKSELFYSISPYSFLNNSPLTTLDPDGMMAVGFLSDLGADIAGVKTTFFGDLGKSIKIDGIETHYVNERGETIANTDDGSRDIIVIRKENEDKFTKELAEKVKTRDDLNPEVNKELGEKYGYNFKEHNRNVDGGKGENYYTEHGNEQMTDWNIGYNWGYEGESTKLNLRSFQPGSFSRSAGYTSGERHKQAGKMHAFEPKLSNSKAKNYIKTNQAPKVNHRQYSNSPIPLLIEP